MKGAMIEAYACPPGDFAHVQRSQSVLVGWKREHCQIRLLIHFPCIQYFAALLFQKPEEPSTTVLEENRQRAEETPLQRLGLDKAAYWQRRTIWGRDRPDLSESDRIRE